MIFLIDSFFNLRGGLYFGERERERVEKFQTAFKFSEKLRNLETVFCMLNLKEVSREKIARSLLSLYLLLSVSSLLQLSWRYRTRKDFQKISDATNGFVDTVLA